MNLRILNCLDTEEGSLGVLGLISGTEGDIVFLENDMLFGLFKRLEFSLSFEFVLINQSPAHSKMPAFLSVSRVRPVSCTEFLQTCTLARYILPFYISWAHCVVATSFA